MSGCDTTFSFEDWANGSTKIRGYEGSNAFRRLSWVYASINAIATTASGAPIGFYNKKITKSDKITDPKHPVMQLFQPPKAPHVPSFKELIYRTFIHLGINGLVYWVFTRKNGIVVEVEPKSKNKVKPIFENGSEGGRLLGWAENTDEGIVVHSLNDVLPIRYYDPDNEYGGLSPLTAARLSIESEVNIAGWNTSFFKTGMKNPIIVKAKGQLTKDQKAELRKEIVNYYSGIEGGQSALLLQGNVEADSLQLSSKDIDFVNGKKLNREEIIAIYQVPPSIVGIYEYANYSNVREQRKIFWEHNLLPKMNVMMDLLQINILDKEFPGIIARWETSEIQALQTDAVEAASAVRTYYDMGLDFESISNVLNIPSLADINLRKTFIEDIQFQKPEKTNEDDVEDDIEDEEDKKVFKSSYKKIQVFKTFENHVLDIDLALSAYLESFLKVSNPCLKTWTDVWIDLVGKELKSLYEHTLMTLNEKSLPININAEIQKYIEKTTEFPSILIKSKKDGLEYFLKNQTIIARTLATGVRENVKYNFYKNTGVKKVVWVCNDDLHKHLDGVELTLGRSFLISSSLKHPHDLSANAIDILTCSCSLEPV